MPAILKLARQRAKDILLYLPQHTFITSIHSGTLPKSQFIRYSEQDDLYLEQWAEIILKQISRLRSHPLRDDCMFIANLDFVKKHLEHVKLNVANGTFNPRRKDSVFIRPRKIPVIDAYLSHLKKANEGESITVGLSSLLGCYDLYLEIGRYSKTQKISKDHPYYKWLSANYDDEFVETAERIFSLTERVAQFELTTGLLRDLSAPLDAANQSYCYEHDFFTEIVEVDKPEPLNRSM